MTTLSTHDTKRSEDVRARLAVLSELPERWGETVRALEAATHAAPPGRRHPVGERPLPGLADPGRRVADRRRPRRRLRPQGRPRGQAAHRLGRRRRRLRRRARGLGARRARRRRRSPPRLETFLDGIADAATEQQPQPEAAAADLARRPRRVPGHRAPRPLPGRPGQPPPGRLRRPRATALATAERPTSSTSSPRRCGCVPGDRPRRSGAPTRALTRRGRRPPGTASPRPAGRTPTWSRWPPGCRSGWRRAAGWGGTTLTLPGPAGPWTDALTGLGVDGPTVAAGRPARGPTGGAARPRTAPTRRLGG